MSGAEVLRRQPLCAYALRRPVFAAPDQAPGSGGKSPTR